VNETEPSTHIIPARQLLIVMAETATWTVGQGRVVPIQPVLHDDQGDRQHPAHDHRSHHVADPRHHPNPRTQRGPGFTTWAQNSKPVRRTSRARMLWTV